MNRFLFTTGTARGGTNLLAQILSVNEDVSLSVDPYLPLFRQLRNAILLSSESPEVRGAVKPHAPLDDYYFSPIKREMMRVIQRADPSIQYDRGDHESLLEALAQRMSLSSANLVPYLHMLGGATYAELLTSAIRLIEKAWGAERCRWVGFNENWAIEFFTFLARVFPGARFVIILRDPRAAIASALRARDRARVPHVLSFARHWRKYAAFAVRYQKHALFSGRLLFLTYERLVMEPEQCVRELTEFLEISFDPEMLNTDKFQSATGERWAGNSHFNPTGRGIYRSSIDAWRGYLPKEVVETIEFICDPEMGLFGYIPAAYTGHAAPSSGCLEFIAKDCRECLGWRTDFEEIERDVGYELFRKNLLSGWTPAASDEAIEGSFLFRELYEALLKRDTGHANLRRDPSDVGPGIREQGATARLAHASKAPFEIEKRLKGLYGEEYFRMYVDDPKRRVWYRAEHQRIVRMKSGGVILDVGCGVGHFLELFDSTMWQKYGVDISDYAISQARARGIIVKEYESAYDYPDESFDVIVFRGTLQHLDTPFTVIKRCVALLKPGGLMAFLSTPNASSLCYKLFGTLPFLSPQFNFLIPSDTMLKDTLTNFGLEVIEIRYPYLETPYARPVLDHLCFILRCVGIPVRFAFWGNIMEVYAVKPAASPLASGQWALPPLENKVKQGAFR